jgi:hypothetical protein
MSFQFKRRAFLAAMPAAALAGATPVAAQAETAVEARFRVWQELKRGWDAAAAGDLSDDDNGVWCDRTFAAADAVLDAEATGPKDVLLKIFAYTFDGEHEIGDCVRGDELWEDIRRQIG